MLPPRTEPLAFDPDLPYGLGTDVRILANMHDCALLMDRIARDAGSRLLEDADFPERDTVYVMTSSASCRTASGVEAILSLFEQPRSCREVSRSVCAATGLSSIDDQFFEDLVRAGILTASPETSRLGAAAQA